MWSFFSGCCFHIHIHFHSQDGSQGASLKYHKALVANHVARSAAPQGSPGYPEASSCFFLPNIRISSKMMQTRCIYIKIIHRIICIYNHLKEAFTKNPAQNSISPHRFAEGEYFVQNSPVSKLVAQLPKMPACKSPGSDAHAQASPNG